MRKFNKGDDIKYREIRSERREPYWTAGKYVEPMNRGHSIAVGAFLDPSHNRNSAKKLMTMKIFVKDEDITAYKPLTNEEVTENGVKNLAELLGYLQAYQEQLLLPNMRSKFTHDADSGIITLIDTDLTIEPATIEHVSIVGITEFAGWTVSGWKTISNYPNGPDDVDGCPIAESRTAEGIARIAVAKIWEYNANRYWENLDEIRHIDALIDDMKKDG